MEAIAKANKRRQTLRRGVIIVIVAVLIGATAVYLFSGSSPSTVTIPTTTSTAVTTTTLATASTKCATAPAAPGFTGITCASPAGKSGSAPTMVIPDATPPTKLEAADLITGTGTTLAKGDAFEAQYVLGDYASHKILQTSWTSGPFNTTLDTNHLIPGWVDGLVGMKVGGRRELILPPSLGYGKSGSSGIPANDTLVFIVDLLKVTPAK